MTDADWLKAVLAALAVVAVAPWVAWVSRAAGSALSRREHQQLCEAREKRFGEELAEIKKILKDESELSRKSRHAMGNRLTELSLRVATLPGYRHTAPLAQPDPDKDA